MGDFDLVLRGGTVADGTGAALREADVAVKDGRIAAVGGRLGQGAEEIDARGLLVTPGFVEVQESFLKLLKPLFLLIEVLFSQHFYLQHNHPDQLSSN